MTGMKEGAGEDPFADDENDDSDEGIPAQSVSESQNVQVGSEEVTESAQQTSGGGASSMQIPYKFRRDGVQDGRDRVPLFLQEGTKTAERSALRELENEFEENVSLTDLREAVVMVGLSHLAEVKMNLEEWGYGMKFE